jgi:GH24 family phage-related lysozyme (muramidase)
LCKFKPYVNYTDTVINFIKESEGLILTPTRCPANKLSIGYGHIILKNEKFKKITKTEANCLLEYDFEKCYCLTSENLNHYQKLAMAHFIYSVGINNYKKIKRKIRKGEYIGNELLKYVYYKDKKGNNIFSTNAKKGRLFELKMFYNR